ncbi:hypothetical protein ACTI_19870 [Actinoplanes sp. OR16]|nr:hypothetical protein ACTI_19870 [Actinoplanes sp. OR16]
MTDRELAGSEITRALPQATVEDVLLATEELREAEYPDIPADLLHAILAAQRDNLDDGPAAARSLSRIIETFLSREAA